MFYIKHKYLGVLVFRIGANPRLLAYVAQCVDVKTAKELYGAERF